MPGLSDDDGKMLIADTLRLYVGQGKRLSWDDLAEATGDEARTLRSYVERDPPRMPGPMLMRVFAVLPPEAFGRVCRRMGFATPRPLDVDGDATVRRALTEAAQFVAEGSEALEDGDLNHRERASLARRAGQMIPKLATIAGGAG
jgi:hypothetical protein